MSNSKLVKTSETVSVQSYISLNDYPNGVLKITTIHVKQDGYSENTLLLKHESVKVLVDLLNEWLKEQEFSIPDIPSTWRIIDKEVHDQLVKSKRKKEVKK